MRNALAYVPSLLRSVCEAAGGGATGGGQQSMAAAALRQAFIQPDRTNASQTLRHVADQLRGKWPKLGAFMDDSEADVLAHMDFPAQHRTKSGKPLGLTLHSTNST